MTGVKSTKEIIVTIFKDNKTFEEERAFCKIEFSKEYLKNGAMELHFTIEPDTGKIFRELSQKVIASQPPSFFGSIWNFKVFEV